MVSGQVLTIALRVAFDFGDVGREVGVLVRVADRDRAFEAASPALAPVSLAWTYADHAANDAQARDLAVDRVVARLFAERARQEAVRLNREGRFEDARHALDGVRKRVAAYASQRPGAQRDRRRAPGRAGGLRRADAGDGPQVPPLRGEPRVPDADAGRQVHAGLMRRGDDGRVNDSRDQDAP